MSDWVRELNERRVFPVFDGNPPPTPPEWAQFIIDTWPKTEYDEYGYEIEWHCAECGRGKYGNPAGIRVEGNPTGNCICWTCARQIFKTAPESLRDDTREWIAHEIEKGWTV